MDSLKHQFAVTLEEKHELITLRGGYRGGGKIFFLENMVKFLQAELEYAKQDRDRWKSAALYYADKLAKETKKEGDGNA